MTAAEHDLVLVVDFGAQYAQLIARRVREARVYSEIVPHTMPVSEMLARSPKAIILSGGPSSVYAEGAPGIDTGRLHGRHPRLRHVLRLPADGPRARRRGGPHRRPRVRPHRGHGQRGRHPARRHPGRAHRVDVARRLRGRGAGGLRRAGLDRRSRRSRRSRTSSAAWRACSGTPRCCTPSTARRCSSTSWSTSPTAARPGPWSTSSTSRSRRSAPRSASAARRSAACPAASTRRWRRPSCSARSATG